MKQFDTSLYFITDSTIYEEGEFLARVKSALEGGVTLSQLREKNRSTRDYIDLAKRMEDVGVRTIIFTDIDCDGMLSGPNLKQLDDLTHEVGCNIIASGGVAVLKDIINLSDLDIYGAICGKSLYSGTLDLKQAIEMTKKI